MAIQIHFFTFRILILRNMATPAECDSELEVEVKDECENYGIVKNVVIHVEKELVKIFVRFETSQEVQNAISALNGRYFARRRILAERYDEDKFEASDFSG
jgi:RNA recognition motif-containing protein